MTTNGLRALAATVDRHTGMDGDFNTAAPGQGLYRCSRPSAVGAVVYVPALCLVVQWAKEVLVGGEPLRYDAARALLVSVDPPADPAVVGELLAGGAAPPPGPPARGLGVVEFGPPLAGAVGRLLVDRHYSIAG